MSLGTGIYCDLCGADAAPDALRECAVCGAMAYGECWRDDPCDASDKVCSVCFEDMDDESGVLAIVLGEEEA